MVDRQPSFTNPNLINPNTEPSPTDTLPILDAANKLEKQLFKDNLTGCYNRNFFENFKLNNFDANRDHKDLGLVFIDVNNLKDVNDNQGHDAGDTLIKDTSNFLKTIFRKEDLICRIGGDEFTIICRNHENDPNFEENFPIEISRRLNENPPTSFASGVAVYNKETDNSNFQNVVERADQLMYSKKDEMKSNR